MMMIPHGTFSRRQRLAAVAAPVWSVKRFLDLLIPTYTQTNSSREKKKKKNRLPFCTLVFMCRYRTFHGGLHAKKKQLDNNNKKKKKRSAMAAVSRDGMLENFPLVDWETWYFPTN